MKNKILLSSAALVGLATLIGLLTAIGATSPETITRASSAAGIIGLGSIGLFMVGLVMPKEQ